MSDRAIGRVINRHASTIGRERQRNATRHDGIYRHSKAHQYAMARRRRCRRGSRYSAQQWAFVDDLLRTRQWSPQQIAERLGMKQQLSISHETIYRRIRRDRVRGGNLWRHLRVMSKIGRKQRGSPSTRGRLVGKRHISERPPEVDAREQFGHWEGDTVIGADRHHCVLTLVERVSRYTVIQKLTARTKEQVNLAMHRALAGMRKHVRTITLDNGTEFHGYDEIEQRYKIDFYFATPYHSWERGTNENTNGLIRQYLPKGCCMKNLDQDECDRIAKALNTRPRKRLEYRTPEEVLSSSIGGVALGR
jgi:IS30 family transposase